MSTMTLDRVVDRALAKAVWVRNAITNMHEMRDSYRCGEDVNERAARRQERKIAYWTEERDAVDHALAAIIETRRRIDAACEVALEAGQAERGTRRKTSK